MRRLSSNLRLAVLALATGLTISISGPAGAGTLSKSGQLAEAQRVETPKADAPRVTAPSAFQITPYVWAAGLGGDLAVGSRTVTIDKSFSDLLSDLDGAFFVSAFGRQGRLVFLGDLSWSSSSRAGILPPPAPPLPAEGRLRQISATAAAGYRVADSPAATLDVLGGLRHWRLKATAEAPALGFSATRRASFTDPIIGARLNARLAPDWSALVYADVGGFGVGSEFTGQIVATVNYAATDQFFLSAGYRHLHVDYRGSGLRADMRMSGPLLGASWRF